MNEVKFDPKTEAKRVQEIRSLHILDTPPEERFDRLTRIASRCLNTSMALISLIDENRQWFKSSLGVDITETPKKHSFCAHAILQEKVFHIPNAKEDSRFTENPYVVNSPNIRMYAGQPIHSNNMRIGTLCVLDQNPRKLNESDLNILKDIAHLVEVELELRKAEMEKKSLTTKLQEQEVLTTSLKKLVLLDGELNLPNKLYFELYLNQEEIRQSQEKKPIGLIACSIDEFSDLEKNSINKIIEVRKKISDALAHIPKWPRGMTFLYDRNRFMIVLPEKDLSKTTELAYLIQDEIHKLKIPFPGKGSKLISLSLACTSIIHPFPELNHLIEKIWTALNSIKFSGGNRVKSFQSNLSMKEI